MSFVLSLTIQILINMHAYQRGHLYVSRKRLVINVHLKTRSSLTPENLIEIGF